MNGLGEWRCRNYHVAAFLRYCLPDGAHLETIIEQTGPLFVFENTERCRELSNLYYNDPEPIAIGDLKAFVDQTKLLRTTVTAARSSPDQRWENKESKEI